MNRITTAVFIFCLATAFAVAEVSNYNSRIINGFDAERNQFPYQVSLQEISNGKYEHNCGGTLISTTRVLTAAHCTVTETARAVFGMLNLDEVNSHPDVQIRNITRVVTHKNYNDPSVNIANYDIRVLHLSAPVTLSPAIQIAPLGTQDDCDAIENALASGWGLTNSRPPIAPTHLKYVTLPRISLEECKRSYANLGSFIKIYDTVVCTTTNPGIIQGVCTGDSGGPLVRASNKRLIGVVSAGSSPCEKGALPILYSSVCKHREFINNNL